MKWGPHETMTNDIFFFLAHVVPPFLFIGQAYAQKKIHRLLYSYKNYHRVSSLISQTQLLLTSKSSLKLIEELLDWDADSFESFGNNGLIQTL